MTIDLLKTSQKMKKTHVLKLILSLLIFSNSHQLCAQMTLTKSERTHKNIGDALRYTMPMLTLGTAILNKHTSGESKQFAKTMAGTLGVTYALKWTVRKTRPNGENNLSFPSGHTSVAFASAAFVQRMYGWKWGIPAYGLASYVGYTRIRIKKHDGWDVFAGALIGTGIAYWFTRPEAKRKNIEFSSGFVDNTPVFGFTYKF